MGNSTSLFLGWTQLDESNWLELQRSHVLSLPYAGGYHSRGNVTVTTAGSFDTCPVRAYDHRQYQPDRQVVCVAEEQFWIVLDYTGYGWSSNDIRPDDLLSRKSLQKRNRYCISRNNAATWNGRIGGYRLPLCWISRLGRRSLSRLLI